MGGPAAGHRWSVPGATENVDASVQGLGPVAVVPGRCCKGLPYFLGQCLSVFSPHAATSVEIGRVTPARRITFVISRPWGGARANLLVDLCRLKVKARLVPVLAGAVQRTCCPSDMKATVWAIAKEPFQNPRQQCGWLRNRVCDGNEHAAEHCCRSL